MINVQFIKSPNGDELAVLPRAEFEALLVFAREAEDDAADVAAYDAAMAADPIFRRPLPADVSAFMLKGDGALRAFRRKAGLSQAELAAKAGIAQGYLSQIEAVGSKKTPSRETLTALANALGIDPEWLIAMRG